MYDTHILFTGEAVELSLRELSTPVREEWERQRERNMGEVLSSTPSSSGKKIIIYKLPPRIAFYSFVKPLLFVDSYTYT
jgi:hypothetical protein